MISRNVRCLKAAAETKLTERNVRPPLKWAGGKYRLLDKIKELLPPGKRLIEPFVGSGVVFLNTTYPRYTINDINQDLITFYRVLKKHGDEFIEFSRQFFVPGKNAPAPYYEIRKSFNSIKDDFLKSALFLYLNKHGYNGLCRYNASGELNVPFGRYKTPYFPEKELHFLHFKLRKTAISCRDFEPVMREAGSGDVIYCDPPYVPLSETSNFTTYSAGGFRRDEQIRLATVAEYVCRHGVTVLISNHHTQFTRQLYKHADLTTHLVRRLISCDGNKRGLADELLALYLPSKMKKQRRMPNDNPGRTGK